MDEIVDFEYLLRPIEEPVGNPRIERFEIRSLRNAEFDKEEQYLNFMNYGSEFGEEKAPEPADWSALVRACETHLAKKVKDFWVCAWYIEALLIRDGFPGLAAGLELASRLVEDHWDVIEPSPNDEDGVADTVKMFAGLNNGRAFIDRLMMTPITAATGDHPALTTATADEVEPDVRSRLISASDAEFQERLGRGLRGALENFDRLNEQLKERCGDDAPPAAKVRETLGLCQRRVYELFPHLEPSEDAAEEDAGGTALVENEGGAAPAQGEIRASGNHVQNREEAFRLLEQVSKFFRETEPSSPVSYALSQAVRWGRMSLPELINDLVDDDDARRQIFRVTGIPGTRNENEGEYEED